MPLALNNHRANGNKKNNINEVFYSWKKGPRYALLGCVFPPLMNKLHASPLMIIERTGVGIISARMIVEQSSGNQNQPTCIFSYLPHHVDHASEDSVGHST